MKNSKKLRYYLDAVLVVLWISIFFWIFYKGSINVGIWGKWEDFEIVLPLVISFFLSLFIILPLYLLKTVLMREKR